jgi:signal transduction histidine kinase
MISHWTNLFAGERRVGACAILGGLAALLIWPAGAQDPAVQTNRSLAEIRARANTNLTQLTRVEQIRNLVPQEASKGYPVRVTAVVTHNDPPELQFVQDDSAGIYVEIDKDTVGSLPPSGGKAELVGFTSPGLFAPQIHAVRISRLGSGSLPPAKPATLQTLITGTEDSQWVALTGVIRNQLIEGNYTVLTLATKDGLIKFSVPDPTNQPAPRNFIDAAIEVRGVCTTQFNERRQLQDVALQVPGWTQITIKQNTPENAATMPVRPVSELLQFHPGLDGLHRSRIRGVLTLQQPDGSLYVQDGSGGVRVQPKQAPATLALGRIFEIVGFPGVFEKLPVLQDAMLKPLKEKKALEPAILLPDAALNEDYHATLVQVQARVIGQSRHMAEEILTVQFGSLVVDAILEQAQRQMPRLEPGSVVRLTGVYVARMDDAAKVRSFQLLLRNPAEVGVLSRPAWWNARRILWVLAAVAVVLGRALAWVHLLRKRVRERTRELRDEMAERRRMQEQVEKTHRELLATSRQAGMAEVATSVLHNVGNVLNSVNVSANLVADRVRQSKSLNIGRVAKLLQDHADDLGEFLKHDPKGRQVGEYLDQLALHVADEQRLLLEEISSLRKNIEHIKEIVAMQQGYAKVSGVVENASVGELLEDALRMDAGSLARHGIEVVREYDAGLPEICVERHKVLQILVNLIRNAKHACDATGRKDKCIALQASMGEGRVIISVVDNGIGIPPENLRRIFHHGFTTRRDGHGFGLHSGALTAKELGGVLRVHSEGPGQGATFTLELPLLSGPAPALEPTGAGKSFCI